MSPQYIYEDENRKDYLLMISQILLCIEFWSLMHIFSRNNGSILSKLNFVATLIYIMAIVNVRHVYMERQKLAYSCEFMKHRADTCITIYL